MIGKRLGCWVLERELGRGGMGSVFLARRAGGDDTLPDRAAVKVLAGFLETDEGARIRFQREIDVLSRLDNPHIVRFLQAGEEPGQRWYAMEYVDGPSYEAILEERGKLPWAEVLELALQVCLALKHAHDHGVFHRDLKPSNLLRDTSGVIKLTDFGIAWVFAGEHLTVTGAVVGTPEFLSPEQAAGKPATKKSDLYSLGILLYTLLTGSPPFTGEVLDVLHRQRYGQPEKLSRLVPDLPHDLEQVIHELLEKEPEKRPPDAGVLLRRLDSLRRKYQRRANRNTQPGTDDTAVDGERRKGKTGPATVMARLMRDELDYQKHGGPLARFFNHPVVLLTLFLITVGLIVWAFLPPSPEKLFERGAALMKSDDPADWEEAWNEYLSRLSERHPDFRSDEVEEFRRKAESATERRHEERNARLSGPMSEAHWFYEKGLRLYQQGRTAEAKAVWKDLVTAFGEVDAESAWVRRARQGLEDDPANPPRRGNERWESVRQAQKEAKRLEREGNPGEATKVRDALRRLYADDSSAADVLNEEKR